jgi:hypothetical protein
MLSDWAAELLVWVVEALAWVVEVLARIVEMLVWVALVVVVWGVTLLVSSVGGVGVPGIPVDSVDEEGSSTGTGKGGGSGAGWGDAGGGGRVVVSAGGCGGGSVGLGNGSDVDELSRAVLESFFAFLSFPFPLPGLPVSSSSSMVSSGTSSSMVSSGTFSSSLLSILSWSITNRAEFLREVRRLLILSVFMRWELKNEMCWPKLHPFQGHHSV